MQQMKDKQKNIVTTCILLILVLVILYSGLRILESTVLVTGSGSTEDELSKTITWDGADYYPRQDITVVMVLGIDQYGPVAASHYYRNEGSADSIILLIFDDTNQVCNVLYLNRDTMVNMDTLGIKGEYAGTAYGQLALAHTYGTGLEDSCVNVKNTLEKFLHGLTIDHYVSMNMDAIPLLNDFVGGVTVTVVDDFSKVNPSITMGGLTLKGEQVIDFVRTRKDVGDQKNTTRMERQKEYVNNFLQTLKLKKYGDTDIAKIYEQVSPYIVTDCTPESLSNMLKRYGDFPLKEFISLVGENVIADGYYEFYADEKELEILITDLFYRPKSYAVLSEEYGK